MKKTIALIDDSFPEKGDSVINSDRLSQLINLSDSEWKSEVNLKSLVVKLINTDIFKNGDIQIFGFTHPGILLNKIEEDSFKPDVVIYDWEYSIGSGDSGENLLEILSRTDTFTFVYSSFFDAIPPTLNKKEFDKYASQIQLLEKGERISSIFSSEQFIIQYVLGLFSKSNVIEIASHEIKFNPSGYLEDASDILYLESVLGKAFLIQNLDKLEYEISKEKIEQLFSMVEEPLFLDRNKENLLSESNELNEKNYGPLHQISYSDALKLVGVKGINQVLNSGIKYIKK
ncbi:hypothetical protein ABN763_02930 [Spongiivirga sp. MCCC 1A20706]|uniref:hypothetical protein n=1 Tax=Spongiivirga sp. MCCC 1A20706 TaxID=3160963 RepID=UPI0039779D8D